LAALAAPLWLVVVLARAPAARPAPPRPSGAERHDAGRFTVVAFPDDRALARTLLAEAQRRDTFPGLPRPRARVLIAVAPDARRFREWVGPAAPEWGAAVAFPRSMRIVMQGRTAGSEAGEPRTVLRHELAHLALHEALGDLPPRWFDEGYASYAAGEWGRDETLATNVALLVRGMPTLDSLEAGFYHGAGEADASYALAWRAVSDLAERDRERGLSLFFQYWKQEGRFDPAVRRAFGITAAAFEKQWQERTRRRYGVLALVANLSIATSIFSVVLIPMFVMRRRRDRRRMDALREADAAAEREERALAALLGEPPFGEEPEAPRVG
ncbi:hypothetical protein PYV61_17470, partial [Roseisolibacter sp. H3M3-2]